MKYIEELNYGQIFVYEKQFYILTNNFKHDNKKNIQHMCTQLNTGAIRWLDATHIVSCVPVFYQDDRNLLHPIEKPYDIQTNI
jgi:hypothetical protein